MTRSYSSQQSRRQFLTQSAAAATGLFAAPVILRARNLNEKLNIAVIGVGGRGASNLAEVAADEITAICDVNEANLNKTAERFPMARKETDYRKLYEHDKEFDAVVVSTCEHTHAFATLPALKLGKHVYCEKPLTHNIFEARIIREAAAEAKVATQMGIQIHAGDNYRRVVELIQKKAIGEVKEAHVWTSRAWGWQGSEEEAKKNGDIVLVQNRPEGSSPIPAGLHWDLWLGPAPERPFHEAYFPGPKWYRWWEWGSGTMSDLGSHMNDLPFWALDLKAPLTIEAQGPKVHPDLAPASMQVTYEFGKRGALPPVKMTWYQGINKPQIWKDEGIPKWDSGMLFIGEKGMLLSDYGRHVLLPEKDFENFQRPDPFIPASPGQQAEWIQCIKTGKTPSCNFDYSGWLTEANHLGNVAYRIGKKLEWDPVNLRCPNAPEADQYIRREYRKGWELV